MRRGLPLQCHNSKRKREDAGRCEHGGLRRVRHLRGLVPGAETVIRFVPENEVNYSNHKLPADSFLGEALVNAEVGDVISLDALGDDQDQMELTVLRVGRD